MPTIQPTDNLVRSPHYRTLLAAGAQFKKYMDATLVDHYGKTIEEEISQAKQLGLIDLSALPRTGFKGRGAIAWARTQNLNIGEQNNQAYQQNNGALAGRLADTEILVLNNPLNEQDQCKALEEQYRHDQPRDCYSVPRFNSSAWLLVTGQYADAMFAKLCGVDLRINKFPNGTIAQTSVARMNAIIIRNDFAKIPAFHFLFDSASTDYMWSCLKDAFIEFNGAPVGHTALLQL